eukprot:COSAG01_NODE_423_length_17260_cov_203.736962_3_plen_57_part_00
MGWCTFVGPPKKGKKKPKPGEIYFGVWGMPVAASARLRAPRLGGCAWSMANGCGWR